MKLQRTLLSRHALLRGAASALVATLLIGAVAWACDTPVYRYAMYNWTAESYVVVYAYDGEPSEEDREANDYLANAETADSPANIRFLTIDISNPDEVQQLPPEMQGALEGSETEPPYHAVFTPHNRLLLKERLAPEAAQRLVDSPARAALTKHLRAGSAGVLILLQSENEGANAQALQEAEAAITRAAAGEIRPFTLAGAGVEDEEVEPFEVALIVVSRNDPEEQTLVNMLLDVEDDLREFNDPMIFGVYGRARAGWPYLGQGITRENMDDCLAFMSGACSCEVKEQNPGMDLLVAADWNAAAEALALKYQDDTADEFLQAEAMFPAVINTLETEPDADVPSVATQEADDRLAAAEPVVLDIDPASDASAPDEETLVPADKIPSEQAVPLSAPATSPLGVNLLFVVGGIVVAMVLSTLVIFRLRG